MKQLIIYIAIAAFGIQFVNSLQLTNMSSLFKLWGASNSSLPYLGLAAPMLGLLIQPLIGQISDHTCSRFGKRKPYIFIFGLLGAAACGVLPFSCSLSFGIFLTWIVIASTNGAIESLRALTGDIVADSQKAFAFSYQTVLSGLGAGLAVALPYIFSFFLKSNESFLCNSIPKSIQLSFIIGSLIIVICIFWAISKVNEKHSNYDKLFVEKRERENFWLIIFFKELFNNIKNMPLVMQQFGLIQLLSWGGLYAMWVFFSLAISEHIYHLPLKIGIGPHSDYVILLQKGTITTNFYFSIYQFSSVIYALTLPFITKLFSEKNIHGFSLIMGSLGLILITYTYDFFAIISMVLIGIMWGSIMTLPYVIVTKGLPKSKMGVYLGLFNITITLPQIVIALLLQPLFVHVFHENAISIIRLSSFLIFISGALTLYWFSFKNKYYPKVS